MSRTPGSRSRTPVWLLVATSCLMMFAAVGCSSGDDSSQQGSSPAETEPPSEEALAQACADVDSDAILDSANEFADTAAQVDSAQSADDAVTALIAVLNSGANLFTTLSTEMKPVFVQISGITGNKTFTEAFDQIDDAATFLKQSADDVSANGITENTNLDLETALGSLGNLQLDSAAADQVDNVPECVALQETFDALDTALERVG